MALQARTGQQQTSATRCICVPPPPLLSASRRPWAPTRAGAAGRGRGRRQGRPRLPAPSAAGAGQRCRAGRRVYGVHAFAAMRCALLAALQLGPTPAPTAAVLGCLKDALFELHEGVAWGLLSPGFESQQRQQARGGGARRRWVCGCAAELAPHAADATSLSSRPFPTSQLFNAAANELHTDKQLVVELAREAGLLHEYCAELEVRNGWPGISARLQLPRALAPAAQRSDRASCVLRPPPPQKPAHRTLADYERVGELKVGGLWGGGPWPALPPPPLACAPWGEGGHPHPCPHLPFAPPPARLPSVWSAGVARQPAPRLVARGRPWRRAGAGRRTAGCLPRRAEVGRGRHRAVGCAVLDEGGQVCLLATPVPTSGRPSAPPPG